MPRRVLWVIEMPEPQDGRFVLTQIYSFHHKPLMLENILWANSFIRAKYSPDRTSHLDVDRSRVALPSLRHTSTDKQRGGGGQWGVISHHLHRHGPKF